MRVTQKVCDAADWFDPDMLDVIANDLREPAVFHRKQWEFAIIFLALRQQGFLAPDKVGLSMGSGRERLLYAIAPHVKRLVATDLYEPAATWTTVRTEDPDQFIKAEKPWAVDDSKLLGLRMDMRHLEFPDNTFDFCYSSCALEHIGEDDDFRQHLCEVHRVLKDGGLYVLTTEFTYGDEVIKIPGNYLFSPHFLSELLVESPFVVDDTVDVTLAHHAANYPLPGNLAHLCDDATNFATLCRDTSPFVQLLWGAQPFTSVVFLLRKGGPKETTQLRFPALAETRQFLQTGVARYRAWLTQSRLNLSPCVWLSGGRSRFLREHAASTTEETSGILHTDYCWLGSGTRRFEIRLAMTQEGWQPPCVMLCKVHRFAALRPSALECILERRLEFSTPGPVRVDFDVVADEAYCYAVLVHMLAGHCTFSSMRVAVQPVDKVVDSEGTTCDGAPPSPQHRQREQKGPSMLNTTCKICKHEAVEVFRLPYSKLTGHAIPDAPDDCIYYECQHCAFCFAHLLDEINNASVYDEQYWETHDPDWHGRISQTLRLVLLANTMLNKRPWELEILDFGCGMGTFVQAAREQLQMQIWGHDIIQPKFGREFFLETLPEKRFDIIVSCEVIEHLPFPVEILTAMVRSLKPGGVFAFQTAYYDPQVCDREWWYVGPANGHISLYSQAALQELFQQLQGTRQLMWNAYPGIQAWQFGHPSGVSITIFPSQLSFHDKSLHKDNVVLFQKNKPFVGDSIFYGPYISLEQDDYEILFEAKIQGEFVVSVTHDFGKLIKECIIDDSTQKVQFDLVCNVSHFEIVLRPTPHSKTFSLTKIEIRSRRDYAASGDDDTRRFLSRRSGTSWSKTWGRRWQSMARSVARRLGVRSSA